MQWSPGLLRRVLTFAEQYTCVQLWYLQAYRKQLLAN